MKFKKGDKVRVLRIGKFCASNDTTCCDFNIKNIMTVMEPNFGGNPSKVWIVAKILSNGTASGGGCSGFHEDDLELVNTKVPNFDW